MSVNLLALGTTLGLGSLVCVNQEIPEFVSYYGNKVGIIVEIRDLEVPRLVSVLWSGGEIESLYEDEIEEL